MPGTANSDPLAFLNPSAASAVANSCFMSATMTSGMTITNTTVEGSVHITRNSCRTIAVLVPSDMLPLLVRLFVAPPGQPEVHRLEARAHDLDRHQAA